MKTDGNKREILKRKARNHTEMGRALIRSFVEENLEKMPHKSRIMEDGTRETLLALPNTYKQIEILQDVNKTLQSMSLQPMSSTTLDRPPNQNEP